MVAGRPGERGRCQPVHDTTHSQQIVEYAVKTEAAGTFSVDVNGKRATYTVRPAAPTRVKSKANWWLIGGIILVISVIGSTIGFSIRSRRQNIPPVPPPVLSR
jgi:hypothetical protein